MQELTRGSDGSKLSFTNLPLRGPAFGPGGPIPAPLGLPFVFDARGSPWSHPWQRRSPFPPDGLQWKLGEHPFITTPEVTWADGRRQKLAQLEHPQIWLENGLPAILFCAADGTLNRSRSFNFQIPLKMPGK